MSRRRLAFAATLLLAAAALLVGFVVALVAEYRRLGRFDEALALAHHPGAGAAWALAAVWALVGKKSARFDGAARVDRRRLALAAASGVALGLSFPTAVPFVKVGEELPGFHVFQVLAWVGLVPLFEALRGLRPKGAFGVAFVGGAVFFNVAFWWVNVAMTTFGGLPNAMSIPFLEILVAWCAQWWGYTGALVAYATHKDRWPVWAVAPPAWAAAEILRNYVFSGFPWANLGYAQSENLWGQQLASLGGPYLIAAAIVLVNALAYVALCAWRSDPAGADPRARRRRTLRPLLAAAVFLVAVHAFGGIRVRLLDAEIAAAPRFSVAVLQGNIDQKIKGRQHDHAQFVRRQYDPLTAQADDAGVDLVVWPEASHPDRFHGDVRSLRGRLGRSSYGAHLIVGIGIEDWTVRPVRLANSAVLVAPDLAVGARYDKHHLVPFGEYVLWNLDRYLPIARLADGYAIGFYTPGAELTVFPVPSRPRAGRPGPTAQVAPMICYDAIFPEISVDFARRGANLLVNMTNDAWYGYSSAPHQFLKKVALRAIETRRAVARPANTGISAFIDPAGRIVAATKLGMIDADGREANESQHVPPAWLAGEVPLMSGHTVYVVVGDLFAYLCMGWCLWLWADGVRAGRRPAGAKRS